METTPELFDFKHGRQSYFGVFSPQSKSLRSCIIIEDTPRPYLNWLVEVAAQYEMRLAVVLPFSDGAVDLLSGLPVSFGTGTDVRRLHIPDLAQCVAVLDMHNDPERKQIFSGYDPSAPTLAGLHFWQRIPPSSRVSFVIASRWEETDFEDIGLTLAFTQLDKSEDPQRPELPKKARQKLTAKLGTFYAKADRHASCEMTRTASDMYDLRFHNETIHPHGKPITRLYVLLKHGKLTCNELCRLSGSPSRVDDSRVERGLPNNDGRFPLSDENDKSYSKIVLSDAERRSKNKMYKDAQREHKIMSDELTVLQRTMANRKQEVDRLKISLKNVYVSAQEHFQREYGCTFVFGGDTAVDPLQNQLSSQDEAFSQEEILMPEEREQFEKDHSMFRDRMQPVLGEMLSLEDNLKKDTERVSCLSESMKEIGRQRDDLWREINGKHKDTTRGSKPQETIRKDFFDASSLKQKRGLFYLLQQAGGSSDLLDHFHKNIVPTPSGVAYVGDVSWKVG